MKLNFKNKIVLLTGAGKGIGREILKQLIKEKIIVYAITRNTKDFKKIKNNKNTFLFSGDVRDKEVIENIFKKSKKNKHNINCLINNAGIRQRKKFNSITDKNLKEVFENNFFSIFKTTQQFLKNFKQKKNYGSIVNISSIVGELGFKELSGYASSKSAINGFTKSTALELGSRNIRCNSIAPGFIETEMTETLGEETIKEWRNQIPLKRGGTPEDIANTTLFLASDLSSYITGQVINVCGGMLT